MTNAWTQIPIRSPDITAIRLDSNLGTIYLFNIYNDGEHGRNLGCLDGYLRLLRANQTGAQDAKMIWAGNFNQHHPLWDEDRNAHLFTSANLNAAQPLLDLLVAYNMMMVLPKGIPTLEAMNTKNYTRPDNVFCSTELAEKFISCNTDPAACPPQTDHLPIISILDTELPSIMPPIQHNFKKMNWGNFTDHFKTQLNMLAPPGQISMPESLEMTANHLTQAIQSTIEAIVPKSKPTPFSKRWWTSELKSSKQEVRRIGRAAYLNRSQIHHPIHALYCRARNDHTELIKCTKRQHWESWLEEIDEDNIWAANKLATGPATDGERCAYLICRPETPAGTHR